MSKINNINKLSNINLTGKEASMNLSENLQKLIKTIQNRIEKEIPDVGYFRSFAEDIKNTDERIFAKAISIAVQRDIKNEGKAYLSLNILHPTMCLNGSTELAYGSRNDLLNVIKDANFSSKLEAGLKNLSEKMKNVE